MSFASEQYEHVLAVVRGQTRWPDGKRREARFWSIYRRFRSQGYVRDVAATKAARECFHWLTI